MTLNEAIKILRQQSLVLHGKMCGKPTQKELRESLDCVLDYLQIENKTTMKTIDKIKESTKKLEQEISILLDTFLEENGDCLIEIETNMTFQSSQGGENRLAGKNVKVEISF